MKGATEKPDVAEHREGEGEVDRLARVLMEAWHEAEGVWPSASYVATFAAMARAIVAAPTPDEGRST